ncbi:MAG: cisplatin damage response ATP-dependent DNA ligase [Rhodospirillaceae bacterium]
MKRFAQLLDGLLYQPGRNGKLRLIADYFDSAPDPDRGYGLAALAGTLDLPFAKPAMLRELITARTDPVLFLYSHDYVGDLAETIALMWPRPAGGQPRPAPLLWEVVTGLGRSKLHAPKQIATWLDSLSATERWALLKLITGGLRIGVSARLAKTAFAEWGNVDVAEVEELWHGLRPPYLELFAWAEKRGPKPTPSKEAAFRPFMLSHALEDEDMAKLDAADFIAEWKWDGIRVQAAGGPSPRLYARSGDDISRAFPDIVEAMDFDAVLDGELLVRGGEADAAPFADLQQRLNRKTVTAKMLSDFPAFVRVYDVLFADGDDLRPKPWTERRAWLEEFFARRAGALNDQRFDLSPVVPFATWDELSAIRAGARHSGMEGLMLKRRDAAYVAGRPKGLWFKWKRDPHTADAVLMYAQRGHGKRSSFYSDYTFGVWKGDELVPIGKAYFGFTDAELKLLDKWIRDNTTERFGPVRAVKPQLVLEVAFDAVQRSGRHKSGLALRFPRVSRIRWDKPAGEADHLEVVERLLN